MASYEKRSGSVRVKVRVAGVHKSATFPTKARAAAWALEQEGSARSAAAGELPVHSVADTLARYALEVSPGKRGGRWEVLRLAVLAMELPDKPVADLTPDDVGRWRDARLKGNVRRKAVAPSTVNRELNVLTSALEHARREWRWLRTNPCRDVKRPKNPRHRKRLMAERERDRLLLALGYVEGLPVTTLMQQVAVAMLLALETGMRSSEIVGLTWDRVHKRHVHLPLTKNGGERDVPLSTRAVQLLEAMKGVDKHQVFTVTPASRDALFRKARQRCKITGLTFHDTRHTAVTSLARKVDVLTLAKIIGHRDVKSLMVYYNPSADDIAAMLD